jgi:hypothetical protein
MITTMGKNSIPENFSEETELGGISVCVFLSSALPDFLYWPYTTSIIKL